MNNEKERVNGVLYNKMMAAQEEYRDWLMTQPPEEILNHTYEYTVREDILLALENNPLPIDHARALLRAPDPLSDCCKDFGKLETDYMETLSDVIEKRAQMEYESQRSKPHKQLGMER